ncbi:hypothetical protein MNBD_GAMMA03-1296 [hydrothermal vent metagenome]|uniref:Uncharacterized protein n=1 Tax=hydrothermal vent metagenome TaxID=652676 RepID=A0A3B0VUH8_9ZZZZ
MGNFLILTGLVVVAVFVPIAVIIGVWANVLPDVIAEYTSIVGVALAIIFIIGGNLYCMYGDIKTGRYSK